MRGTAPRANRAARLGLLLAATLLAACSAGLEALNETGSYKLSGQEQHFKCDEIYSVMKSEIARIAYLLTTIRAQGEVAPQTVTALWSRMNGPQGNDLPAMRDYTESRKRLVALNERLVAQKCAPVDLDRQLAETDEALSTGRWRFGTEAEARALLQRGIDELKANAPKTLRKFREGLDDFAPRDLRVRCAEAGSGRLLTETTDRTLADLTDAAGRPLGKDLLAAATPGRVVAVDHSWTRPDMPATPHHRIALVTQIDRTICWVSFFPREND